MPNPLYVSALCAVVERTCTANCIDLAGSIRFLNRWIARFPDWCCGPETNCGVSAFLASQRCIPDIATTWWVETYVISTHTTVRRNVGSRNQMQLAIITTGYSHPIPLQFWAACAWSWVLLQFNSNCSGLCDAFSSKKDGRNNLENTFHTCTKTLKNGSSTTIEM